MDDYYNQEYADVFGAEDEQTPMSRRFWLSWENLKYQAPKNRGIWGISSPSDYEEKLSGISGGAGPGEVMSIVGEIRSGKSLILGALAGTIKINRGDLLTGRVLVNGYQRGERWRRICALVSQSQEEFYGLLTVEEQLNFRAEMALPAEWSKTRRQKVVNWVLQCLDMESVKNVAVDKLILCEKKRLAIGLALVGLPRVLLLDEPLDKLDPTRALELMKTLRRITQQRQMITILTAKQLRETALPFIDRMLLVAKGSTVYYGAFEGAKTYFEQRLGVSIPEKGDNPLICMLDAVSCIDCRRDPNHIERIHREWEAYAFDNQVYRTNYPNILIDGTLNYFFPFP